MKKISLSQGLFAEVDDEDFDKVNKFKWSVLKSGNCAYAVRTIQKLKKKKTILLHRFLMNPQKGKVVDHRDGNGLNNSKKNLRICSHAENMRNATKRAAADSKRKGIFWHKLMKKWCASISKDRKRFYLGYFEKEIEAADAYAKAAKEFHGEFARI